MQNKEKLHRFLHRGKPVFFNRCCPHWRCCCCCLNCFCYLGSERLPFDHLFVRLPSLCLGVLFALHSFVYSFLCLSLSRYCFAGDIHLLFKLLLKCRNVNIPRAETPLLVIKISKKTSPHRWRFSLALKGKERKPNINMQNVRKNIHACASNIRGRTGYNV